MVASGATGGGGDGRRAAGGGRGWAAARRGDDAQAPVAVKLGMRASERSRVRKGRGGAGWRVLSPRPSDPAPP